MFEGRKLQQDRISKTSLRYLLSCNPNHVATKETKPQFAHNNFGDNISKIHRKIELFKGDHGYTVKLSHAFIQQTKIYGLDCPSFDLGHKSWTFVFSACGKLLAAQYSRTDRCRDSSEEIKKFRLYDTNKINLVHRLRALNTLRVLSKLQPKGNLSELVMPAIEQGSEERRKLEG